MGKPDNGNDNKQISKGINRVNNKVNNRVNNTRNNKVNNRETGSRHELQAAAFLTQQGYIILEKNYRCRTGEIDLIAREGAYLVFAEVKYRSSGANGDPAEAVDLKKRRRITGAARFYLLTHGYGENIPCRFDVVAILGDEIRLYRDAFWT